MLAQKDEAMRATLLIIPLMFAAPAAAQTPAPRPQPPTDMQRVLNDPAMADRLANVMQALSQAFLNLPVGEVQAAVEGRPATPAERRLTVRDMGRRDDPNFDRNFQRQMSQARPMIEQSMKAMQTALPAMIHGMEEAGQAMDRAVQNMPRPDYPKR
jgi:hypothetical protein